MKSKISLFLLISFLSVVSVNGQAGTNKKNPVGSWKFEAPYAPEGYTAGTVVVSLEQQKYTASISFTGSEYIISGEKVKAASDSLSFSVFLQGQDIKVRLKVEDAAKMAGKAIYSEGEMPLTLTKNSQ